MEGVEAAAIAPPGKYISATGAHVSKDVPKVGMAGYGIQGIGKSLVSAMSRWQGP